jgi:antitoxin component of RelBE/YafQ-DinJ toxin-antitoxin module
METTTLQIPISKDLKSAAAAVARDYGFSSLQEIVRVILTKLARRQLIIQIGEAPIKLSTRAERRYAKMERDFERGRGVKTFSNVDELMVKLTSWI